MEPFLRVAKVFLQQMVRRTLARRARWEIIDPTGVVLARAAHPNGWSVQYSSSFTVGAPVTAAIGDGYRVRYHLGSSWALAGGDSGPGASGSFGVTPQFQSNGTNGVTGGTTGSTGTNWEIWAVPQNGKILVGWPGIGYSWTLYRGTSPSAVTTQIATSSSTGETINSTSFVDTTYGGGTGPFYYQIKSTTYRNNVGVTGLTSTIASASAFTASGPAWQITGIQETRAHALTANFSETEYAPFGSGGSWTDTVGVVHTVTTTYEFYIMSDQALTDSLSTSVQSATPVTLSHIADPTQPSITYNMAGYVVTSVPYPVTMTYSSSGGLGRLFVVANESWSSTHVSNGTVVGDSAPAGSITVAVTRADYNLTSQTINWAPIDSRLVYGPPSSLSQTPIDPNSPGRNVIFSGTIYSGGIFAGNSPFSGPDLSGAARTQLYLTQTTGYTNVVWQDMVLCYWGSANNFSSDPSYSIYQGTQSTSPATPYSQATWANALTMTAFNPMQTVSLGGYSQGSYVNFNCTSLCPYTVLALTNETADRSAGTADWRYFTTPAFATSLGSSSLSVSDATPHSWIMDWQVSETGLLP